MTDRLKYEELVEDFSRKLVTQLRSHGADREYLEMWVPDADPVKSILNMVEAAGAYGQAELEIEVSDRSVSADQADRLVAAIADLAQVSLQRQGGSFVFSVTGIT